MATMTLRTSSSAVGVAFLLAAVAIPALVAQSPATPQPRPKISEAGAAAISRQLAAAVERGDTPGVAALVVDRDGILYEGAAGKLDVG